VIGAALIWLGHSLNSTDLDEVTEAEAVVAQARAHWGEEPTEVLMELVLPAGQDMTTKADIDMAMVTLSARIDGLSARMDGIDPRMDGLATNEYVLRTLLLALTPLYLAMLGLYLTG
jgi:hypothetical protein